jgi:protein-tyrosine-phosphatase
MNRPSYVFVCLHGSAKSVIASEHFRRLAVEYALDVDVASAGTEPDAEIPPRVVEGLLGDGIDVRALAPRPATRAALQHASRIIAFGCNLRPVAPARVPVERWDDVPAVSDGYARARDAILGRVRTLVDELRVPVRGG